MEKLEFSEWLKGENNLELKIKTSELSKRIDFLTQEVFNNQQSHVEAYNSMKKISERQNKLVKSISQLTEILSQISKSN